MFTSCSELKLIINTTNNRRIEVKNAINIIGIKINIERNQTIHR